MSRARLIPALDTLTSRDDVAALEGAFGRRAVVDALRAAADDLRTRLQAGDDASITTRDEAAGALVERAAAALRRGTRTRLQPAINATGVVIHTNLGRAPLCEAAIEAMAAVARDYATLEFDLDTGGRGSRHVHAESWLCELTGAEAALVANNTAAALIVTLAALAAGREVVISRGELVEIGGGFRVPDVMRASGARLREVGTTNRTRVADYAAAISPSTAALLRVHPSNFRMTGFTEQARAEDLAALAARFSVPLLEDQGSGWLGLDALDAASLPPDARRVLAQEPSVRDSIRAGVDLVAFSGDKLLGGPQCGILVGRGDLVAQVRRHPLMRAVRVDKLTYAALEGTLLTWRRGRAIDDVPVVRMVAAAPADLARRAERMVDALTAAGVQASSRTGASAIGGGTTPGETLPTTLVAITPRHGADALLASLRTNTPPLIARIVDATVCLDLRTVPEGRDAQVVEVVRASCLMPHA